MPNFKLRIVKKKNLTMNNNKINIIFPEELIKINGIPDETPDLKELDTITREYFSSKYAIKDFVSKGLVDCDPNNCILAIVYNKNHTLEVLEPLYKELYHNKQNKTIYEQILTFAHDMEEALIYCFPYLSKRINVNIYYDRVKSCFRKYKWLTKPDVIDFFRESFVKGKQFVNVEITEDMKEQTKTDKRMKFYVEKIEGDKGYLSIIDSFKNNALDEYGNVKNDVDQLEKEYYDALLIGFYRKFVTGKGNFNYLKVREFYREYYNYFIGPNLKIPKEIQQELNSDSLSVVATTNTPKIEPTKPRQDLDYSYVSSSGLSKMTIEEAHQTRDNYFPDEHKNDVTIALNDDGTFVDYDDDEYRHIK